ncbi:MAG: hypothetical protein M3144_10640, partial [Actinomycetota bacterium]|nr:hypothetical protein [Actinomycetota bacterium]
MIDRWRPASVDPRLVDGVAAVACAVVTLVTVAITDSRHSPRLDALGTLLILGQTAPVVWRRSHPVLAWLVVGIAASVYGIGDFPDTVLDLGPLLVIYTVAAHTKR